MKPSFKRALYLFVVALTLGGTAASASAGNDYAKKKPKPGKINAPEFDAKATGSAAALLLGGVLVMADRRRRKSVDAA